MPIQIVRNDITKIKCDAIVNAANSTLLGGGGVDGAIHKAAGKGLLAECIKLHGCKTGQAKITSAYNLPCKYVIHTVGPKWRGGQNGEKELLESCYRNSLRLAKEHGCESVAFPLISSGMYRYPKDGALKVAVDMISEFLLGNEMLVYIVIFDKSSFQISQKLFNNICEYIDDKYVDAHFDYNFERTRDNGESCSLSYPASQEYEPTTVLAETRILRSDSPKPKKSSSLEEAIEDMDESFTQMLLRKIDESGMTDAQCYKKANIDRKLFSKIRSNLNYRPKKTTALAFAIALGLSLDETKDMLMKAGFALSHSNKFDIIVEYFIKNGNYNIYEINEALFAFDQCLLGA